VYVANNPIIFIDPDGRDIYRYDKKTGAFVLEQQTEDKYDQVGKFKYDKKEKKWVLQKNNKGKARTSIDKIEKGILKDGINFREDDNLIEVGGEGQPTEQGVKTFALDLQDLVGKEIHGLAYSSNSSGKITDIVLARHKDNGKTEGYPAKNNELIYKYGTEYSNDNIFQIFHTHPYGNLGAIVSSSPEKCSDYKDLQKQKPIVRNASFLILRRVFGKTEPDEYDYTHHYKPKKIKQK
jgi:hypothetical protein